MTNQLEVSNLITPIITVFKTLSDEWKNLFDVGLYEYLQSQTDKYYFTNTFIHRSEKVRFTDIYYPVKANYKKLTTDFNDLESVFEEYKKITIVGSAGSGKTTLIKHIFLTAIRNQQKIPILIELRNLNEYDGDFEKLIADKVLKSKIKPNDGIFKRALESGKFLFLLDGYDEIFSNKKQEVNRQIELFVDSYPNNYFLITTRPGSGIESFPRFYDFKVQYLDDNDVTGFIEKIVDDNERKERIKQIVLDPQNGNYIEFLRNPLLLSMFIMAFENHPEIPNRKSAFYRNVFDTLYSRHDGITKNSFPREKLTKLQRDDFEEILSVFSYLTLLEGQYSFTSEYLTDVLNKVKDSSQYEYITENLIYDLRTSISILILDGFEYYFPHRSMQEYFTALFINKLPTDKKHKAYSNLTSVLEESSTDYSFNFWSLCFELDETVFISNFLVPQLKKIYKPLEGKEDKALIDAFFDLIKPTLIQGDFEKKGEKELRLFRRSSFKNSILDFCKVYDYNDIWIFPKAYSGCYDELFKLYEKETANTEGKQFPRHLDLKNDSEITTVMCNEKLHLLVEDFRKKLLEKIKHWELDVKRRKINIDNLLNL